MEEKKEISKKENTIKKEHKKDVIEINVGKHVSSVRENPWIVSTIVLGAVLVLVLIFGGVGYKGSAGNVVSGEIAADNLINFLNSQSQGLEDIEIISSEQEGQLYKVILGFQGQDIPIYVSLDGKYLIANPVPLDAESAGLGDELETGSLEGDSIADVDAGDSPFKGDENAPVTIVEFSDYQCPFCARFYTETLPLIEKNYIDSGKVKLAYMDFPLSSIHPEAQKAAEAARCVGEQKGNEGYFAMHDKLFENQQDLSVENYKKWARELKVDGTKFDKCLGEEKYSGDVQDDFLYGQELGVSGTPAFFINGQLISGAQPYSVFEEVIESELSG